MSTPLVTAAVLGIAFVAVAHSYLGERYILIRLFRKENLPKLLGGTEFTKQTLRFAWHLTSIAWLGLGGVLVTLTYPGGSADAEPAAARVIAATFALTGAVALVSSRGRHLSWVVFFAIAALVWLGYR